MEAGLSCSLSRTGIASIYAMQTCWLLHYIHKSPTCSGYRCCPGHSICGDDGAPPGNTAIKVIPIRQHDAADGKHPEQDKKVNVHSKENQWIATGFLEKKRTRSLLVFKSSAAARGRGRLGAGIVVSYGKRSAVRRFSSGRKNETMNQKKDKDCGKKNTTSGVRKYLKLEMFERKVC